MPVDLCFHKLCAMSGAEGGGLLSDDDLVDGATWNHIGSHGGGRIAGGVVDREVGHVQEPIYYPTDIVTALEWDDSRIRCGLHGALSIASGVSAM
eukprot:scaffold213723_cov33-Prasinocladus_malaysianus.AAC.1